MNVLNNQPDPLISADLVSIKNSARRCRSFYKKAMALNAAERPESAVSMQSMLAECDKKIGSNESKTAKTNKTFENNFLAQETKIMAAATHAPNIVNSEAENANCFPKTLWRKNLTKHELSAKILIRK